MSGNKKEADKEKQIDFISFEIFSKPFPVVIIPEYQVQNGNSKGYHK